MTVTRNSHGLYDVTAGGEVVQGPFLTEAAAWRWIDRETMEATSSQENRVDWLWQARLDGGGA